MEQELANARKRREDAQKKVEQTLHAVEQGAYEHALHVETVLVFSVQALF